MTETTSFNSEQPQPAAEEQPQAAPEAPQPPAAEAPARPAERPIDRPAPRYRDRGDRPSYGGDRGERPSYGGDRGDRPSYGGDRGERGGREGDRRGGGRFRRPRRKVCAFCVDKITHIDYKEHQRLRNFVSDRGKILKSRQTGTCTKHQRALAGAIKRARSIALLPYVAE
jgi:small subunit ribosomal protein S18